MNVNICPALLAGLLSLAFSLAAQQRTEVVPANHAQVAGGTSLHLPFTNGTSRTQMIVDPGVLGGLGKSAVISSLGFRPDEGGTYGAKNVTVEVVLSTAKRLPAGPDSDYAANRGNDAVTVLPKTTVSLPLATKPGSGPSDKRVWLRFTRNFNWQGGGLCLEVANHTTTKAAWPVDAARAGAYGFGRAAYEGNHCPAGKNTIVSATVPWPGAPVVWKTRLLNASTTGGNALLLLGLGLAKWGGFNLPFDLDPVVGTRGCKLYTDIIFAAAATVSGGKAEVDLGTLPNDPAMAGVRLANQWLVPDAGLPGGLGASNLARCTIGLPPPFVTLYNYLVNTNPGATRAEFLTDSLPVLYLQVQ